MDLFLVRLARSPRPSAEALRSALLAQPWLVPDSARPRMMNGRPVLVGGVPWMDHGLTQALGQAGGIHPELGELEYAEGTLLALASDGIKDAYVPDFLRERGRAAGATEVAAFCDEMRRTDKKDDSTFVLVRLGEPAHAQGLLVRAGAYAAEVLVRAVPGAEVSLKAAELVVTLPSAMLPGLTLDVYPRQRVAKVLLGEEALLDWFVVLLAMADPLSAGPES